MTLAFNHDFEARHGEAVTVAPGIRRVTAGNAGPLTFRGTNTFLIGETDLAVLDPGPADPVHLESLLRAIGTARVACILVSHTHRDHSPGARPLQARTGARILAAGPHRPARPLHAGEPTRLDAGGDLEFRPDETLPDGAVIEAGGFRLEAVATPGHTANHLAFALQDAGILFSGDHVMGWSTTVVAPPDGSMSDYMASLDRMLARPESLYFPAHGGAIRDALSYVRGLRSHRKMRERAILRRIEQGDRTIPAMVERIYPALDPHLAGAAALSTLAHIEDLVARGFLVSDEPPALDGSYSLAPSSGWDAEGAGLAGAAAVAAGGAPDAGTS